MVTPSPELQTLIAQSPFLELTSSQQHYSHAKGDGLPLIRVCTPLCEAIISLQGAQLLEFKTHSGTPLLWLSPNCNFTEGTALRGGVPICLPWFGPNAEDPSKPKHGFARNQPWELTRAYLADSGEYELTFTFFSKANALFDYDFSAELKMVLGTSAKLQLSVTNLSERPFVCSWALHSYHPVTSLGGVRVEGLADRTYLDNLENHAPKWQEGDLRFEGEVDRVYPAVDNLLTVADETPIEISHHNCPSVITWNPGPENAAKIADIGAGQEQHYICVERGAVLDEAWSMAPGETQCAWIEINEVPSF